jgi:hypothetical protein
LVQYNNANLAHLVHTGHMLVQQNVLDVQLENMAISIVSSHRLNALNVPRVNIQQVVQPCVLHVPLVHLQIPFKAQHAHQLLLVRLAQI